MGTEIISGKQNKSDSKGYLKIFLIVKIESPDGIVRTFQEDYSSWAEAVIQVTS